VNPPAGLSLSRIVVSLLFIAYPFAVYLLLERVGAGVLGAALVALLLIRNPSVLQTHRWLILPALALSLAFLWLDPLKSEALLRLYPVAVSAVLLATFGYTLMRPPTIVARLASASGTTMTPAIERYTRKVTVAWCVFFVVNGIVALVIGLQGSMQTWLLYNGIVSYVLMGVLFAGEYLVRRWYMRQQEQEAVATAKPAEETGE
jgi:uncharacterized membrane protein